MHLRLEALTGVFYAGCTWKAWSSCDAVLHCPPQARVRTPGSFNGFSLLFLMSNCIWKDFTFGTEPFCQQLHFGLTLNLSPRSILAWGNWISWKTGTLWFIYSYKQRRRITEQTLTLRPFFSPPKLWLLTLELQHFAAQSLRFQWNKPMFAEAELVNN